MSHDTVLKQLIPAELGGISDADIALEGAILDAVQGRITNLSMEVFADTCTEVLTVWEAFFGLVPLPEATIESRRDVVAGKLRATGNIFKPHFVALAASMGYQIHIDDYIECMSGWTCAGDEVLEEQWVYFSSGTGLSGDYLAEEDTRFPWIWEVVIVTTPAVIPNPDLETVLKKLKPAELQMNFTYI